MTETPVTPETAEASERFPALTDPSTWFGGAQRALFVHAHPDDETLTTGGTIAGLAAAGRAPAVLTLTRGERGEVVAGPLAELAGTPALAEHRVGELAAALAALGVGWHAFLGEGEALAEGASARRYEDSGMRWGADGRAEAAGDAPEAALTRAATFPALGDVIAAVVASEATCIVSYDDGGGYGHPDHVTAHRLASAVAAGLDLPFWSIQDPEAPALGALAHDVTPWAGPLRAALAAHATQLTVTGDDIVHSGGQRQPISATEYFLRAGR